MNQEPRGLAAYSKERSVLVKRIAGLEENLILEKARTADAERNFALAKTRLYGFLWFPFAWRDPRAPGIKWDRLYRVAEDPLGTRTTEAALVGLGLIFDAVDWLHWRLLRARNDILSPMFRQPMDWPNEQEISGGCSFSETFGGDSCSANYPEMPSDPDDGSWRGR